MKNFPWDNFDWDKLIGKSAFDASASSLADAMTGIQKQALDAFKGIDGSRALLADATSSAAARAALVSDALKAANGIFNTPDLTEGVAKHFERMAGSSALLGLKASMGAADGVNALIKDSLQDFIKGIDTSINSGILGRLTETDFKLPEYNQSPVWIPPPPQRPEEPNYSVMFIQSLNRKIAELEAQLTDENQVVIVWGVAPNGDAIQVIRITPRGKTSLNVIAIDRDKQRRIFYPMHNGFAPTLEIGEKDDLWFKVEDQDENQRPN